jgi:hypothetical protein
LPVRREPSNHQSLPPGCARRACVGSDVRVTLGHGLSGRGAGGEREDRLLVVDHDGQLAGALVRLEVDRSTAVDVATLLVVLLEGAHVLCRASGSLDPFDRAAVVAHAGALARLSGSSPHV